VNLPSLRVSALAFGIAVLALPAAAQNISITVNNNTSATITEVYIDGAQLPAYGPNRLTDGRTIEAGARREFGVAEDSTCEYDLFARDNTGAEYQHRFSLCSSGDAYISAQ
jgi:hypothetical protein